MITFGGAELLTIFNSFDYDIEGEHVPMVKVVLERFDNYFAPRTNELIDRYKFRSCKQLYDETSASYIARLCNLAKTCNFGNEKENNLRDQLVYGCARKTITRGNADIAGSEANCHCPRGSASEHEPVPRTAADARFGDCKQGDEGQGRQKGFAAAGQHGSSTNCHGPGQVQVLWPRTRL